LRARWSAYLLALVAVALALALRAALTPWLGTTVPYLTVFGAIIVVAWLGGLGPALAAALLGWVGADVLFVQPLGRFEYRGAAQLVELAAYLFSTLLITALAERMRRTRRQLVESEQRLRSFMEHTPNAVFLKDADGRYLFMNRAAQALIAGRAWQGRSDHDLLPAPVADAVVAHDRDVLASGQPRTYDLSLPQPDGERRLYSTKFPLRDGAGRPCVGSITVDVTDHRRVEEELQLVTDTMSAAVIRCAADTRILWANRVYCEWMARRFDDVVGRPLVEVIGEGALGEIRPYIAAVLRGASPRYERRVDYPRLHRRWIGAVYSPTLDAAGKATGWVAVVYDIHERKLLEDALAEANRRKDEFLATLAHELRNPLAPIRNAVTLLGRPGMAAPQLEWSRAVIGRQVEQMARLIDDLLDIARISSGKLLLRRIPTPLAQAIDLALETSRPHIEAAGHRLQLRLEAGDAWLDADPTRLAQVLANLLNNAAKYTPAGGTITLSALREGDQVALAVADTGIGFPPEAAAELFQPFSQRASAEHAAGGLGIGLALVRGIVELHGGSVGAQSDGEGRGSRFTVRLPLAAPASGFFKEKSLGEAANGRRLRVLVADDNRDAADSLARLLEMLGHEVRVAYDGLQAEALAAQWPAAVAILDIGMPQRNGYEVAGRLRAAHGPAITLIAATGWGQESDRLRAAQAGFDHHLTKPLDPERLSEILRACS
jgi:PAS domain S-box-containing protein